MNLISNNCIAGFIYKLNQKEYNNPFMWAQISVPDFINLIKFYNKLPLENPKAVLSDGLLKHVIIYINNIKIVYPHYIYSPEHSSITLINNINIYYNNIIDYAYIKWAKRIKKTKEEPVFLFSFNVFKGINREYINTMGKLMNIKNHKIILVIHKSLNIKPKSDNIKIISLEDKLMCLGAEELAKIINKQLFLYI